MNWHVTCFRTFVETDELNAKGNNVVIPVDIRKLYINGSWIDTNSYLVNVVKRKGEYRFSVHYMPLPKKEKWPTLKLRPEPELTWKREGSYNESEFLKWLRPRLHAEAEAAIFSVLTMVPENLAA